MLLLLSFGFAAGIAVAAATGTRDWLIAAIIGIVAVFSLCTFKHAATFAVVVIGISLGFLRICTFFPPGWNIESVGTHAPLTVIGQICSEPVVNESESTFLLCTDEIVTHQGTLLTRGTISVLVHGAARGTFSDPNYGEQIQASGLLQPLVPATNPGEFDWRARMVDHGISGELVVQRPHGAIIIDKPGILTRCGDWSVRTEHRLEITFLANLPAPESALLSGILFGKRGELSPETQQQFIATGTAHILATAGLHIGILSLSLAWLIRLLPIPKKFGSVLIIVLLWTFACLAGGRPAVVRAVIAATIYFGAFLFERAPDIPTTLAAAALGLLSFEPTLLFASDFQLSFVTVIGIAIILPHWEELWKPILKSIEQRPIKLTAHWVIDLIGLSITAQLCSAPLISYYYNQFSILSLPTNLVVVPCLFVIVPAAALTIALSLIWSPLAIPLFHFVLNPLLWLILKTVSVMAALPLCVVNVQSPNAVGIALLYAIVYGIAAAIKPVKVNSQHSVAGAATL